MRGASAVLWITSWRWRGAAVAILAAAVALSFKASPAAAVVPYFEIGQAGTNQTAVDGPLHATTPTHEWVIVLHAGAWVAQGPENIQTARYMALRFQALGWTSVNTDYGPGASSLADVLAAHDWLRAAVGGSVPICVYGSSAGGQLALLTAGLRRDIACAISEGGPTDLMALSHETAYDPDTGGQWRTGPEFVLASAQAAFGITNLGRLSPVRYAARITCPLLLAGSTHDELVPAEQMDELRRLIPTARVLHLTAGSQPFTHAGIGLGPERLYEGATAGLLHRAAQWRPGNHRRVSK